MAIHQRLPAHPHQVPAPFQTFAVRSDEPQHAWAARAPYGWVHVVQTDFLNAGSRAQLAREGLSRVNLAAFSDVDYANTTLAALAATAPGVGDWVAQIAAALALTEVLGDDPAGYRRSVTTRVDYLGSRGAGFHNDVSRHWSRSLFWLLAIEVADVAFVMPHAGVAWTVSPGDLLVFDQTLAHGLCRPADGGQALSASFETGMPGCDQLFLTGELVLDDAQWAALGSPWLPVEHHAARAALDLMVAEFDERSGAIQRVRTLRDGMLRRICHVDGA